MTRSTPIVSLLMLLALAGCSASEAPKANRSLRSVPLTSIADVEAYDIADAVDDQLRIWCTEALELRQMGESLPVESPIVDGRAGGEVARLRAAAEAEISAELATSLSAFALAHEERIASLLAGPKFRAKRYLKADRKVAELAFGLRRWRLQR